MLRTRLWMGALLIALVVGVLVLDQRLRPWYPFLLVLVLGLTLAACSELLHLFGPQARPPAWLAYLAVAALVLANWLPEFLPGPRNPWSLLALVFAAIVLAAFLVEMAGFQAPGESITRLARTVWLAAYLGLLPCFLVQLRWLPDLAGGDSPRRATTALALAIFVPKCADIGAYFTGRLLGRHPMAPVLSPKKTWEGTVGGLVLAILVAVGIDRLGPVVRGGAVAAAGLGLALGVAGTLGDLAESLLKRDSRQKDASQMVPGFGGVLDVVDSIVFAAPVAYGWLA